MNYAHNQLPRSANAPLASPAELPEDCHQTNDSTGIIENWLCSLKKTREPKSESRAQTSLRFLQPGVAPHPAILAPAGRQGTSHPHAATCRQTRSGMAGNKLIPQVLLKLGFGCPKSNCAPKSRIPRTNQHKPAQCAFAASIQQSAVSSPIGPRPIGFHRRSSAANMVPAMANRTSLRPAKIHPIRLSSPPAGRQRTSHPHAATCRQTRSGMAGNKLIPQALLKLGFGCPKSNSAPKSRIPRTNQHKPAQCAFAASIQQSAVSFSNRTSS